MNWPDDIPPEAQTMLEEQLVRRGLRDRRVLLAIGRTPRELFVPPTLRGRAWGDRALPIACDQTISQPYMVGLMTAALELSGAERVLEIGTGSGYQTAILAQLASWVTTVERHALLSEAAAARLATLGHANVTCAVGDASHGWPAGAPYERILVTAAAAEVAGALFDDLAEGGILVAPVGPPKGQHLQQIRKIGGKAMIQDLGTCRFVPLVAGDRGETDGPSAGEVEGEGRRRIDEGE